MIYTVKDIANAPDFKAELSRLINDPVLQTALRVLSEDNMPERQLAIVPGMTAAEAVAWDYSFRCGVQAAIKRLKGLPLLTAQVQDYSAQLGRPWEYLLSEEAQEDLKAETEESSKVKRIPKPKQK